MFSRQLRHRLMGQRKDSWVLNRKDFTERRKQAGRIFAQKPLILKEALGKCDDTLIYVDVDAILLDRLDHAVPKDCDVGVTVLPREDRKIGRDPGCGVKTPLPYFTVNAGVIFLRANERTAAFLGLWLAELDHVRHSLFDQTALASLLYRDNPAAFEDESGILQLAYDGGKINVAKMPCRIFNRYKIDPLSNKLPSEARVVHFVGAWKSSQHKGIVRALAKKEISARANSGLENKALNGNPA
ncbi:MAG: putative nucleotide-diphospho-sugar transferase [Sulfuricellaceae bacterium]